MPSNAFNTWNTASKNSLDGLDALVLTTPPKVSLILAHTPSPRSHLLFAYTLLLSSRFQAFCRDLHSEAVDYLTNAVQPPAFQLLFRERLTSGRKLDHGNPNPGNLGADFGLLGFGILGRKFWDLIVQQNPQNSSHQALLEGLNNWRNAIAHHDFQKPELPRALGVSSSLRIADVRRWRGACDALAGSFDVVVRGHVNGVVGQTVWV